MVTIETTRLVLRQPLLQDFEEYALIWADAAVMRFLAADGRPLTRFAAWQSFSGQVGHWQLRGFGLFTVIERASGSLVGRVGPWYPEGWPDLEVGWTLRSGCWGRGYATEAGKACLAYVFNVLARPRVISLISVGNTRSIRVAERLGETLLGEVVLPHMPNMAVLQYGLSRAEWEATLRAPDGQTPGRHA
jgi:RimJ/RimL family protein N-acetyltransferase